MYCAHDPGLALFLAETRAGDAPEGAGWLNWSALAVTMALGLAVLALPG